MKAQSRRTTSLAISTFLSKIGRDIKILAFNDVRLLSFEAAFRPTFEKKLSLPGTLLGVLDLGFLDNGLRFFLGSFFHFRGGLRLLFLHDAEFR